MSLVGVGVADVDVGVTRVAELVSSEMAVPEGSRAVSVVASGPAVKISDGIEEEAKLPAACLGETKAAVVKGTHASASE